MHDRYDERQRGPATPATRAAPPEVPCEDDRGETGEQQSIRARQREKRRAERESQDPCRRALPALRCRLQQPPCEEEVEHRRLEARTQPGEEREVADGRDQNESQKNETMRCRARREHES